MPTFQSKPLQTSVYSRLLRRYPALFGLPFNFIMVGASFVMKSFTQTRYDFHSQKVKQVRSHIQIATEFSRDYNAFQLSKEDELGLTQDRKMFDIREEYYVRLHFILRMDLWITNKQCYFLWIKQRLQTAVDQEWESKRIARPKGLPEWGVAPTVTEIDAERLSQTNNKTWNKIPRHPSNSTKCKSII